MKTFKILLAGLFFLFLSLGVIAQGPPNPPDGGHGSNDNQPPGGGAALSGGIFLLLTLGAGYGGKKVYDLKKKKEMISE
ncbi:MAG TPA: hypothetical protein VIN10_10810 [Bacteroidales bacterium]